MAFVALEKLHRLYDGYRRVFRLAGREWVLLQEQGKLYCFANQCPHLNAPLLQATIHGHILRCPSHGIEFDLRNGRPKNRNICKNTLTFLPVIYEVNQVGVDA